MKKLIFFLTIFTFLFAADLQIIKTEPQILEMKFLLEQYGLETVNINGQTFQKIKLNNQFTTTNGIGQPELPLIVKTLALPENALISIEVISSEYEEIGVKYSIWPHQKPEIDCANKQNEFIIDQTAFQKNVFSPTELITISPTMTWRDLKIVHLKIAPISYNPVQQKIRLYKTIRLRVNFSQSFSKLNISPNWLKLYQRIVFNFSQVPYGPIPDDDFYLMVVHQNFANSIDSLINFYQDKNVQAEKLIVDANWTPEQIKAEILKRYQNNSLDWVLLVGDAEHIKPYWYEGLYDSFPSDAYFSFLVGDDFYAEIGIGRLSGKTNEEIIHQVEKILNYQKSADGLWLNKSILIAHREEYPDKYSKCKRGIFNFDYQYFKPEMDTLFGACGATNLDVIDAINQGVGIVNYRGHGSTRGWTDWSGSDWRAQEIDQLENGNMTPIIFNIACLNHKFYWPDSNCLGEHWVKKYPGGAVASLGATNPSYTGANHDYDKMLYQAICEERILPISLISNFAAAYILENHGQCGEENVKMFCWFGDPAMKVKFDQSGYRPAYPPGIILSCFPNPAHQKLTIKYYLPKKSKVSLKIYDINGRLVNILQENIQMRKGYQQIIWSGQDTKNQMVSSGIYFIYLSVNGDNGNVVRLFGQKIIWLK